MDHRGYRQQTAVGGFALPTILIASLVMIIVMLFAVQTVVGVKLALDDQYYNKIGQEAAESGVAMARACINQNSAATWTDASPLRPNTTCTGGDACNSGANCFVLNNPDVRTSFSVGQISYDNDRAIIDVDTTVELLRTSNQLTWKSYYQTVDQKFTLASLKALQLSSGGAHTCMVGLDRNGYCWGNNDDGQLGNNSTTDSLIPVPVYTGGVLFGKKLLKIEAGINHTCAITTESLLYCWGQNTYGGVGNGTSGNFYDEPVAITGGTLASRTVRAVALGDLHTCVIADTNAAHCWGRNFYGQVGNAATMGAGSVNVLSPVAVNTASSSLSGRTIREISASYAHTCVIADNNTAHCWGQGDNGELGNNGTANSNIAVAVNVGASSSLTGRTVRQIAMGGGNACVIADNNTAHCWGEGSLNANGDNSVIDRLIPVAVNTAAGSGLNGKTVRQIKAASGYACAIASDNNGYCWGYGANGRLGNNATSNAPVPVAVNTAGLLAGKTLQSISLGGGASCAIASDVKVYCWGGNASGQYGNGGTTESSVPMGTTGRYDMTSLRALDISSGVGQGCALASDLLPYCWGGIYLGTPYQPSAVDTTGAALAGKTFRKVVSGTYHACGIASDNLAYCWGENGYGQLGNNNMGVTYSATPVPVYPSGALINKTIRDITADYFHTCAIASDNLAYCWGDNSSRQLGNNSATATFDEPVAVYTGAGSGLAGRTVREISAGSYHVCAIANTNTAHCWGDRNVGQNGDNAAQGSAASTMPTTVVAGDMPSTSVRAITSGGYHSCVIHANNNAYCWGLNNPNGGLGDGSNVTSTSPSAVNTSASSSLNGRTVQAFSAGSSVTCVIASDLAAHCWGYGANGRLGRNSTADALYPAAVTTTGALNGKKVNVVSVGNTHVNVVASDGLSYGWGANGGGRIGLGGTGITDSLVPALMAGFPTVTSSTYY